MCSTQEAYSRMITGAQGLGNIVSLRNNNNKQNLIQAGRRETYNACIAIDSLIDFISVLCSKLNYTETNETLKEWHRRKKEHRSVKRNQLSILLK